MSCSSLESSGLAAGAPDERVPLLGPAAAGRAAHECVGGAGRAGLGAGAPHVSRERCGRAASRQDPPWSSVSSCRLHSISVSACLHQVSLRPWGEDWRCVGHDVVQARAGKDTFHALYYKDGIHPSAVGTFLESCVITSVISGMLQTPLMRAVAAHRHVFLATLGRGMYAVYHMLAEYPLHSRRAVICVSRRSAAQAARQTDCKQTSWASAPTGDTCCKA